MTTDMEAGRGFGQGRKIEGRDWPWRKIEVDAAQLPPVPPVVTIVADLDPRSLARSMGFTGDMCVSCGGVHMQRAGHCEVCSDCGTTTSCS